MKSADILYDLLRDKTAGQVFYNEMMVRVVNPLARDLFIVRRRLLALESKPALLKSFIPGRNP